MTQPTQDIAQRDITEETTDKEYKKFHTFDFHSNVKFQAGWSKIVTAISDEKREADYLKAKLFFYSKLYGKVTREGYEQWLKDHPNITQEGDSLLDLKIEDFVKIDIKSTKTDTQSNMLVCNDVDSSKKMDGCQSENRLTSELKKGDNLDSTQMSELGFSKIAEMLEKGLKLPGVEELNIKPLDIDPNPPEMERMKKPWEK
ncbi:uncharacterized protein LOC110446133 [Mizuhopecten yessoensis]|uniref:Uncharacterized protein n=1 Tax=Mizuhopecten yessoensis TaxID=6573 RepID=A0A210QY49_MIZYE|nr:uncharacterized protein LOC110446133 [Mizuhopecten yessoensis]XP_021346797.1 uncharacterized protein LOC110446133 [Mizuhopecten yessoensis]XP_021346798.1 uncharacterized protein LOC110446133 [Mizuhopecten yessoensis]OWF53656.1 hypothetical protein KP79_PYT00426 [Mizuhopecten yessoensis]